MESEKNGALQSQISNRKSRNISRPSLRHNLDQSSAPAIHIFSVSPPLRVVGFCLEPIPAVSGQGRRRVHSLLMSSYHTYIFSQFRIPKSPHCAYFWGLGRSQREPTCTQGRTCWPSSQSGSMAVDLSLWNPSCEATVQTTALLCHPQVDQPLKKMKFIH